VPIAVEVTRTAPRAADVVGVPVSTEGPVPRSLGLGRAALAASGFEGKVGQTLVLPAASGPARIAVGIGAPGELSANTVRTAAAALARAVGKRTHLATSLAEVPGVDPRAGAQAVVEGVLLATYRYTAMKSNGNGNGPSLATLSLVTSQKTAAATAAGVERGRVTAEAVHLARDLANTPPAHLTASKLAERAVEVAARSGLGVEVFDEHALAELGCGGLLGVNRGSTEPPRMVKLTYSPRNPQGHVVLVGKGVVYDSGGISLKPSDGFHLIMKMDMTGAAVVLATMSALRALRCRVAVTGFMMLTDNMPSGSAMKLGDVLTFRNGKTAEVHNTDAEGRLILADGLSLGAELRPDAMIDIATLTGACLTALGLKVAGVLGNDQALIDRIRAASERTDEPVWQLPLVKEYRKLLDSSVADMKNVGGPYGGTITAALFLNEFVGDVPWAHLDIAGPMNTDSDDGWLSKGATGFGTRLLIDLLSTSR
jgi:leucyl aminopeptidase